MVNANYRNKFEVLLKHKKENISYDLFKKEVGRNLEDDENDEVTQAWKKDEYECNEMIKRMNLWRVMQIVKIYSHKGYTVITEVSILAVSNFCCLKYHIFRLHLTLNKPFLFVNTIGNWLKINMKENQKVIKREIRDQEEIKLIYK